MSKKLLYEIQYGKHDMFKMYESFITFIIHILVKSNSSQLHLHFIVRKKMYLFKKITLA